MRKQYIHAVCAILVTTLLHTIPAVSSYADEHKCSGCHAEMAEELFKLPDSPPSDLLHALSIPCFNYSRVLEEWYYVEELFVTIEHHLIDLEEARYHVEPFYEELIAYRNLYREVTKEPVVSLADFRLKTGKLRYDVGKIYRIVKEKQVEQHSRNVFGAITLIMLFLMILVVLGWRIVSGSGVVHPSKTKLGYDDYMEHAAKNKEDAE